MFDQASDLLGLLRKVMREARLEEKRIVRARNEFIILSFLVATLLLIDYSAALVIFEYLDPTLGKVSMGPAVIALCVPTAVVALHLLMHDTGGEQIEQRLKRFSGVGVFIFLLGIAAMLATVYMDAADGVGSGGPDIPIDGTIGNQDLGSGGSTSVVFAIFRGLFSGITPIIFFIGMTAILWVTVYASHRLLVMIEERYQFFVGARRRYGELSRIFAEIEPLCREIVSLDAKAKRARKRLPDDAEYNFSRVASAAFAQALHRMGQSLRGLDKQEASLGIILDRKPNIPEHVKNQKEGHRIIARLRQATTPYAILAHLDGFPPKDDEEL
ncbi:MAG: hypothetical protein JJ891_06680 [Rhizobiaceae bacterium]|jgi:hypothetical protein|nr:hypothetical protein [Rhizobiaceae bacterium]